MGHGSKGGMGEAERSPPQQQQQQQQQPGGAGRASGSALVVSALVVAVGLNTFLVWLICMGRARTGGGSGDFVTNAIYFDERLKDMVEEMPTSAGHTVKQGTVPFEYFMPKYNKLRTDKFRDWFANPFNEDGTNKTVDTDLPWPFPYCQVYVNHHYKYIWIKGHKVASTSMRGGLGHLCGDRWRVPDGANFSLCADPAFKNRSYTEEQVEQLWKDYFVFAVVRNPFSWFASAQVYLNANLEVHSHCTGPDFVDSTKDPYMQARICRYKRNCKCQGSVLHHIRHVMPQWQCMFTKDGKPALDFIAAYENLQEDFDTIAEEIDKRKPSGLPPINTTLPVKNTYVMKQKELHHNGTKTEDYSVGLYKSCLPCMDNVSKQYRTDFELFGYPR